MELGGAPLSEDAVAGMVGGGVALLVRRALDAAGLDMSSSAVARFLDIYDRRLLNHTRVYRGIIDVLRFAASHATLTVLTNKPLAPSERLLDALQLRPFFGAVIGGDGPYARKPDPAGLLAMMRSVGAPAGRTMLVGDSAVDHETARRASARSCTVTYGFGFRRFPREVLGGDDWLVDDAEGLETAIRRFSME
jgi:phosphoglycolate phosphatase